MRGYTVGVVDVDVDVCVCFRVACLDIWPSFTRWERRRKITTQYGTVQYCSRGVCMRVENSSSRFQNH